jgi:hypothetical protein
MVRKGGAASLEVHFLTPHPILAEVRSRKVNGRNERRSLNIKSQLRSYTWKKAR